MSKETCKRCPYAGFDCQDAIESGDCPDLENYDSGNYEDEEVKD